MNKQELLSKLEDLEVTKTFNTRTVKYNCYVLKSEVVNIINQLDAPQRVVIPQFVADKIEYCKSTSDYGLFHAMDYCFQYKDSADWLEDNQETFAKAWLEGYEVEQESLYVINIGAKVGLNIYLRNNDKELYPDSGDWTTTGDIRFARKFTEAEIKQEFEWTWQFAEEVE